MEKNLFEERLKTGDSYNHRVIVKTLSERTNLWKLFFRFSKMEDYLTLTSSGHLNVRGGDESLFKSWGKSEFKDIKPIFALRDLESLITLISLETEGGMEYSFSSYREFTNWLTDELVLVSDTDIERGQISQYAS
ncbi:MAG: hypothetical protein RIG61_01215 [Deltaproteobacteria bacterium]